MLVFAIKSFETFYVMSDLRPHGMLVRMDFFIGINKLIAMFNGKPYVLNGVDDF